MKKLFLVVIVLLIAVFTRGYLLGSAPRGVYVDEAGIGYSAYSVLNTGKDEFGKSFPIVFRSFLDFKTPGYIYITVPLIKLFGLSAFTVRLTSFLLSVLSILILYLLIKELTDHSTPLAFVTSLLLSLSPWHILFGRSAFECNAALFFVLLGLFSFFKAIKNARWFILSALSFGLSIETYHAERITTPLLVVMLVFHYRAKIWKKANRKYIIAAILLVLAIIAPMFMVVATPGFSARAVGLNIFNYTKQVPHGYQEAVGVFSSLANFKPFLSIKEFVSLYISYFNPRNMFILGDPDLRSSFPYLAPFFIWQLPFYFLGFYALLKEKRFSELRFVTIVLFVIAPIPAAVTRDPYSTIRALPLVIPQIIIISQGILYVYHKIQHASIKKFALLTFTGIICYSCIKLYSSIFVLNEYYRASFWDYGWSDVVSVVKEINTKNFPVVVDNSRNEPYMHILFFSRFAPKNYQQDNPEIDEREYYTKMERSTSKQIGYFVTRPIKWEIDLIHEGFLVGDALAISPQQIAEHKLTLIKEIHYPDGSPAFRIVKVNP